jgi:hypothetical protein
MAQLTPPLPPPEVVIGDDDSRQRLQFRLWQMTVTTATVLVALWLSTFGVMPAILAWVVAKHILVAVYMMGLHRYPRYKGEGGEPPPGN